MPLEAVIQRARRDPRSLSPGEVAQLHRALGNRAVARLLAGPDAAGAGPGGLPAGLKAGVEALSGLAMDEVRVHRDSARPAGLGAVAYAQGTDIYLGPGQERHLPHEAWHVVQQAQGRVRPTMQVRDGVAVSDDAALEQEAAVMGARALAHDAGSSPASTGPADRASAGHSSDTRGEGRTDAPSPRPGRPRGEASVVQRAVGFEFEDPTWTVLKLKPGWTLRDPNTVYWYNPTSWSSYKDFTWSSLNPFTWSWGNAAPAEASTGPSKYSGKNIWQSDEAQGDHIDARVGPFNLQTGPKKGTLHAGPGYNIEPDGPYNDVGSVTNRMDLEVVTKPFPETPEGRSELVTAMDDLKTVVDRLRPATGLPQYGDDFKFEVGNFVTPATHRFTDQSIYLYGGTAGGAFKPQVTSGHELADLPELMQTLGPAADETAEQSQSRGPVRTMVYGTADAQKLGNDATIRTVGEAPRYAQAVLDKLATDEVFTGGVAGLDALRGFLAQAILNMSVLSRGEPEGIKIQMPLLSRLSMATLWGQVPEQVREEVVAKLPAFLAAMDEFVKQSIRGYLSLKYSSPYYEKMVKERSSEGLDGPMIRTVLNEYVQGIMQEASVPTKALGSIT
jgi:hypothetical protein